MDRLDFDLAMATPKFNMREMAAGSGQSHLTLNEALRLVDFMLARVCHSFSAFEQPNFDTEVFGVTHIINGNPSGEWAGKAYWIAHFNVGRWWYIEPKKGMTLWLAADQSPIVYIGDELTDGPWYILLP